MDAEPESEPAHDIDLEPGVGDWHPRRTLLGLPLRTVAICICIATIAALAAGIVASIVLKEDPPAASDPMELTDPEEIDLDSLLAVGLTTVDGQPTTLAAQLDGRPMVVNLWGQWCAPCIEEMPLLEAAHKAHPEVAFLGVHLNELNGGDQLSGAKEMAAQTAISYPWVMDEARDFSVEANVAAMPTTLLLDPRGRVQAVKTGVFSDQSEVDVWIAKNTP